MLPAHVPFCFARYLERQGRPRPRRGHDAPRPEGLARVLDGQGPHSARARVHQHRPAGQRAAPAGLGRARDRSAGGGKGLGHREANEGQGGGLTQPQPAGNPREEALLHGHVLCQRAPAAPPPRARGGARSRPRQRGRGGPSEGEAGGRQGGARMKWWTTKARW